MVERERKEGELEKRKDARMVSSFEPNDRHGLILLYKRSRYDKADAFCVMHLQEEEEEERGVLAASAVVFFFAMALMLMLALILSLLFISFHSQSFPASPSPSRRNESIRFYQKPKLEHKVSNVIVGKLLKHCKYKAIVTTPSETGVVVHQVEKFILQ